MTKPAKEIIEKKFVTAGYKHRMLALAIDFLIVATVLLFFKEEFVPKICTKKTFKIVVVGLFIIYKPTLEILFGQTLGKKIIRIKVVTQDNSKAGFKNILLRNLAFMLLLSLKLYVLIFIKSKYDRKSFLIHDTVFKITSHEQAISLFFLIFTLIDVLTLVMNPKNRALHDYIGGSKVIRPQAPQQED